MEEITQTEMKRTIYTTDKSKNCFFEKINKIYFLLAQQIQKKEGRRYESMESEMIKEIQQ